MVVQTKICPACNAVFELGRNKKKIYCTQQCWLRTYNRPGAAHSIKGAKLGAATNIARYRGTGASWYVKENQRHQHRVVAERILGRALHDDEVVHHEDNDKKNNDPRNLIVFPSQGQHARHHMLGHPEGRNLPCDCSITRRLG